VAASKVRKLHTGEPGNGGEFGTLVRDEDTVTLTAAATESVNVFDDVDFEWARSLAEDESTPGPVLSQLARSERIGLRAAAAGNESTSNEVNLALARDPEPSVRRSLSWRSNLSTEVVAVLVADDDIDILEGVAGAQHLTLEQQKRLANSEDSVTRNRLAQNPIAVAEIVDALATDEDQFVRYGAAGNPNLSDASAMLLTRDADASIRERLTNRKRSLAVQEALFGDESAAVRYQLVTMPGLDSSILERLRNDANESVKSKALRPRFY
jgi:hypothetical protein